jgi:hydroxyacyl-ACP dehydratase HTD2-like protein with hotdog domain
MDTVKLRQVAALLLLAVMASACAKTDTNPFRHSNAYSALPYVDDNTVHVLATGELQYNP